MSNPESRGGEDDNDNENLDEMKLADLPVSFLSFLDADDCLILEPEVGMMILRI